MLLNNKSCAHVEPSRFDIKCLPLLDTIVYELTMSTRDMAAEAVSLLKLASETRRT